MSLQDEYLTTLAQQQLAASTGAGPVVPTATQQAENYARHQEREERYEAEQREQRIQSRDDTIRQAALHGALVSVGTGGDFERVICAARAMEAFLRGKSDAETVSH